MKNFTYLIIVFFISLVGILFSGYLSAVKLFTSTCVFKEPCATFLGHPACLFGFGIGVVVFMTAIQGLIKTIPAKIVSKIVIVVSGIGILFAAYFVIPDIENLFSKNPIIYTLLIPICAYGIIFFIITFILSVLYLKNYKEQ